MHYRDRVALIAVGVLLCSSAPAAGRVRRPERPLPPPFAPAFVRGLCLGLPTDDYVGCYEQSTDTIYVNEGGRETYEHELGHAFDAQVLTDVQRWHFETVIGRRIHDWSGPRLRLGYVDPDVMPGGEEFFAEAYKTCRLRMLPQHGYWSSEDYIPRTDAKQRHVCSIIARWSRQASGTTK